MATRCNILVFGSANEKGKFIYRHYDGYPLNMVDELTRVLKSIGHIIPTSEELANKFIETNEDKIIYELSDTIHTDIDYAYIVYPINGEYYFNVVDFSSLYDQFSSAFGYSEADEYLTRIFESYRLEDFQKDHILGRKVVDSVTCYKINFD